MPGTDAEQIRQLQHDEDHLLQQVDAISEAHLDKVAYVDIHDTDGKVQFWVAKVGSMYDRGPDFAARPLRHIGKV